MCVCVADGSPERAGTNRDLHIPPLSRRVTLSAATYPDSLAGRQAGRKADWQADTAGCILSTGTRRDIARLAKETRCSTGGGGRQIA